MRSEPNKGLDVLEKRVFYEGKVNIHLVLGWKKDISLWLYYYWVIVRERFKVGVDVLLRLEGVDETNMPYIHQLIVHY